jgi:hypothetical protein
MVYPEDFFPAFHKILDDLIPDWCFFLPLDPTPWRGDVVCYDSLEGGDGPGTRLREEFLEDVNSLLPGIHVVTSPLPVKMAQVSALSLLEPQAAKEFTALESSQQEYYRDACEVLDRIGRLLNGPLRGYDERQELEQSMDALSTRLTTMHQNWETFQQGSIDIWYSDAASLIQESRFFSIHAIFDLVTQRFQEYLRFRKFRRR